MALSILPADGFITRLLQQSQSTTAKVPAGHSKPAPNVQDQASISQEARQATQGENSNPLESKLIDLYNQKGNQVR
ncbi:hypothetical protein [Mariprofundus sp. EBB-1]|uniref:hypothetical protein n=1 Tax=Mariprofundus sp. EBB-1 TaxID=2650971 RepID=UPI001F348A3A|nr:hypothetical protein [Mariprofundus sp. EBB-1]